MTQYFGPDGARWDSITAVKLLGAQDVHVPTGAAYRLTRVDVGQAPAGKDPTFTMAVSVRDGAGSPAVGAMLGMKPRSAAGDAVTATTDLHGEAMLDITPYRFAVTETGGQGPAVVGVKSTNSDMYNSVGWVQGSRFYPARLTFQWEGEAPEEPEPPDPDPDPDPEPGPEPVSDQWAVLLAKLDRIIALLEARAA